MVMGNRLSMKMPEWAFLKGWLAERVFGRQRMTGYAFDCEALLLSKKYGARIKEVGVHIADPGNGRVRVVRDSIEMLLSLVKLRARMWGTRVEPVDGGGRGSEVGVG